MKKLLSLLLCLLFAAGLAFGSYAEKEEPETTQMNMSAVKLMVTDYTLEGGSIIPGESSKLTITIKNTNNSKSAKNIKLTLSDGENEIIPDGMGTLFLGVIYAGSSYTWETSLSAVHTAAEGRHQLSLTAEYEDINYSSYSSSDTIFVDVRQPVSLDFDGAKLPVKVIQSENVTLSISLMNTGKSELSNVRIKPVIDGLDSGGITFVGNIPAGEIGAATVNLRVSSEILGKIKGKIKILYEDVYGTKYNITQPVSTLIEEKIEIEQVEEEEKPKYPLWWAFLLGGVVLGGGIGCAVPIAVYSSKQRKEDEMRL